LTGGKRCHVTALGSRQPAERGGGLTTLGL
jgi:hypothetical protein